MTSDLTNDMITAGARSIGRTMRFPNFSERAKDCWESMMKAKETGDIGELPNASEYRDAVATRDKNNS